MVIRDGRMPQGVARSLADDQRTQQVRAAETRLLYENFTTGTAVTILIASVLAYAHWDLGPRFIVSGWLVYMLFVSAARFVVSYRYWHASPSDIEHGRWNTAVVVCVAMAAAGWGGGAIMLYPSARPLNEILLVFAVGGVMLGGASTLAARALRLALWHAWYWQCRGEWTRASRLTCFWSRGTT